MKQFTSAEVKQALRRMHHYVFGQDAPDPFPQLACSGCGAPSPPDYELLIEQDDNEPNKIWIKGYLCPACEVRRVGRNQAR